MEYRFPFLFWPCLLLIVVWSLDFFHFTKRFNWKYGRKINKSSLKQLFQWFLFLAGISGLLMISYSLTQPRIPESFSPANIKVNDIILVIDVSRSMLADDIQPNRLEAAKNKIREFVKLRPTDRISIITFSEKVMTLLPLTTDPDLADEVLSEISIGYLGSGTNIGDALALGVARGLASDTKNKVIILLTDGVSNVGNMTPIQAGEIARDNKMKVYTIGLGTDDDARIPVGNTMFGTQYQKIPGGSIDYETLQKISEMTGGKFYPAQSENGLKEVLDDIQKLEKTEIKAQTQIVYEEKFYYYLFLGILIFVMVEICRRFILREAL